MKKGILAFIGGVFTGIVCLYLKQIYEEETAQLYYSDSESYSPEKYEKIANMPMGFVNSKS